MSDSDFYLDGDVTAVEAAPAGTAVPVSDPAAVAQRVQQRQEAKTSAGDSLYFDLETIPDQSRLASFDLPELPPIPSETPSADLPDTKDLLSGTGASIKSALQKLGVVSSDWLDRLFQDEKAGKDRSGVMDDIAKSRSFKQLVIKQHEDRLKLLSTTPEFCSICAIGIAIGSAPIRSCVVGDPHPAVKDVGALINERDILESFWARVRECSPLIGFNIIGFDLPVIMARSAILGVPSTRMIDLKPWAGEVLDLYLGRFGSSGNSDSKRPGTLKKLAKVYGIDVPAGDFDGSGVYEAMKTPEGRAKVGQYVASDVHILRELHRALAGYFWV